MFGSDASGMSAPDVDIFSGSGGGSDIFLSSDGGSTLGNNSQQGSVEEFPNIFDPPSTSSPSTAAAKSPREATATSRSPPTRTATKKASTISSKADPNRSTYDDLPNIFDSPLASTTARSTRAKDMAASSLPGAPTASPSYTPSSTPPSGNAEKKKVSGKPNPYSFFGDAADNDDSILLTGSGGASSGKKQAVPPPSLGQDDDDFSEDEDMDSSEEQDGLEEGLMPPPTGMGMGMGITDDISELPELPSPQVGRKSSSLSQQRNGNTLTGSGKGTSGGRMIEEAKVLAVVEKLQAQLVQKEEELQKRKERDLVNTRQLEKVLHGVEENLQYMSARAEAAEKSAAAWKARALEAEASLQAAREGGGGPMEPGVDARIRGVQDTSLLVAAQLKDVQSDFNKALEIVMKHRTTLKNITKVVESIDRIHEDTPQE